MAEGAFRPPVHRQEFRLEHGLASSVAADPAQVWLRVGRQREPVAQEGLYGHGRGKVGDDSGVEGTSRKARLIAARRVDRVGWRAWGSLVFVLPVPARPASVGRSNPDDFSTPRAIGHRDVQSVDTIFAGKPDSTTG